MSDLADFLLARITEDKAEQFDHFVRSLDGNPENAVHRERASRTMVGAGMNLRANARVLAVRVADEFPKLNDAWLRRQALPYADHPDYRDEWRP